MRSVGVVAAIAFLVTGTGCSDKVGGRPTGPDFVSVPVTTARVDVPYGPLLIAMDPDGGGVDYELVAGPEGLTLDGETGQVSWTPAANQVGFHTVHVRAEDGEDDEGELIYSVEVRLNSSPEILGAGMEVACVGDSVATTVYAVDADGDAVTLEAVDPPAGLTLDPATGALSWAPDSDDAGTAVIEIRAEDPYGGVGLLHLALEVEGYSSDPMQNTGLGTTRGSYETVEIASAADGIWAVVIEDGSYDNISHGIWLTKLEDSTGCRARASRKIGPFMGFQPYEARIAVAPDGSLYVATETYYSSGSFDVEYVTVQKFDANGDPAWVEPVRVTDSTYAYEYLRAIVADDTGVAVLYWDDNVSEMHLQKLSAAGARLWGDDGVFVNDYSYWNGDRQSLGAAPAGDVVAFWNENSVIYGQRFDAPDGGLVWTDGLVVMDRGGNDYDSVQVVAGPNGDWITFVNGYDGSYYRGIQRVDGDDGTGLWTSAGANVDTSGNYSYLSYTGNGIVRGGASQDVFVTWIDNNDGQVYVHRLDDLTGVAVWPAPVPARTSPSNPLNASLAVDGDDVIAVFEEGVGPDSDILAQKFGAATGARQWGNGALISTASGDQERPVVVPGGQDGGAVIGWYDYRNGDDYDAFVQKVRADGTPGS